MSTALIVIDVEVEYFSERLAIEFPPRDLMGVELSSTSHRVQTLAPGFRSDS